MSAPALTGRPTLRIAGTPYPVLLPSVRDPRLHLAAVIVSLQVLGQVAFEFQLSIAQILVSLLTCAVLEVAIAFRRQRVLLWPASALLTGNGVAFILRVPGTEHGDWWSMHGWWIFAGTAAVALLSKYVIRFRGHHVFNPSNIGLVLCFLLLGADRAEPLDFWWGPLSAWLVLALAIIVTGGLAILRRLRLLGIAVGFWLVFVAGLGVLAASGHAMTARWHLGPVADGYFWLVLAFSPEVLVFLFFMITDPKTVPAGRNGRLVYGVAVALVATLLIAPQQTEFGSKVALLAALALVCGARPLLIVSREQLGRRVAVPRQPLGTGGVRRFTLGTVSVAAVAGFAGLLVVAGIPARTSGVAAVLPAQPAARLPALTIAPSDGVTAPIDRGTALGVVRDLLAALRTEAEALRERAPARAAEGADGVWLAGLWRQIGDDANTFVVPVYDVQRVRLALRPAEGQSQPTVLATLAGTRTLETHAGSPPALESSAPTPFERTVELDTRGGRYVIIESQGGWRPPRTGASVATAATSFGGVRLESVAAEAGLDFHHAAFRFGASDDEAAMMGGGLCWLDYDGDGWLDLYAVNSYPEHDYAAFMRRGGLPRSTLFRNRGGRFEDVGRRAGAALPVRGSGCVAADLDQDGDTDLYVTTAGYNVETDGYDALLWNDGDGTFTEGAQAAGVTAPGWHAGAAVGDVNGDGRPDVFVAGYTDLNAQLAGSEAGFPTNHAAVRDRLYLNEGPDGTGRPHFREVAQQAGIERAAIDHGLGAVFTDVNGDGRLDLYVANDLDPNRLYENVEVHDDPAGLGFRFEERGSAQGVDDDNAGMGIAAADFDLDGRADLLVTNSRNQLHAVLRHRATGQAPLFADARAGFAAALGADSTGWGASWADLDLDGAPDLLLANGAIPVLDPKRDAERVQVFRNLAASGHPGSIVDSTRLTGLGPDTRVNGRGLAAADYDNDGDVDFAVNSVGGPLLLLRTARTGGHWLEVELRPFSPGAEVTVVLPGGRTLVREVHAGSSYLSSEDPRVHFGLGNVAKVDEVRVRYPGGGETTLTDVGADRLVTVRR